VRNTKENRSKDTDEFGVRFFGRDYAHRLGRWVRENYHSEVCIGALPLKSDAFGILLLRRIHPYRGVLSSDFPACGKEALIDSGLTSSP